MEMVMVVDLVDGSSKENALPDTMLRLLEGVKAHRNTWIVLE